MLAQLSRCISSLPEMRPGKTGIEGVHLYNIAIISSMEILFKGDFNEVLVKKRKTKKEK